MPAPKLSIFLNLATLRPVPERLRRLVAAFGSWGYDGLCIEWDDAFPWATDERFRGAASYREELVAGLYQEAAGRGLELDAVFPSTDSFGFAARMPVYRHLFRWDGPAPRLDLGSPAGRKFYADLVEDFITLVPEAGMVVLDHSRSSASAEDLRFAAELFGKRRLGLRLPSEIAQHSPGLPLRELAPIFETLFIPPGMPFDTTPFGRVIYTIRAFGEPERKASMGLLDEMVSGTDRPDTAAGLLLSFQRRRNEPAAQILGDSIELVLERVRAFGEEAGGRRGREAAARRKEREYAATEASDLQNDLLGARGASIAGRLEVTLASGWSCVRQIRELLAEERSWERDDATGVPVTMERLQEIRMEAQHLAGDLFAELGSKIDPDMLRRRLDAALFPLSEEYHMLVPHVRRWQGGRAPGLGELETGGLSW